MKKIYLKLALVLVCLSTSLSAQVFFVDSFNSVTPPALPSGWTQKNLDGFTVHQSLNGFNFGSNAWVTRALGSGSPNKAIVSTSYYTTPNVSNDWIVSPQISIPASAANAFVNFIALSPNPNYLDGFTVKISTTDTAVGSFTDILSVPAATTTWEEYGVDISSYKGQNVYIAIVNNSNDKLLLYVDNFAVKQLPTVSVSLKNVTPLSEDRKSFVKVNSGGATIKGTFKNLGATTLNSINVSYFDGTNTVTETKTGLNLAPFKSINFSFNTPVSFSSIGTKNCKVWISVPSDVNPSDDSSKSIFFNSYNTASPYKMLIEQGTGTWCGWCPRGIVYMDSFSREYPDAASLVAVHNNDPMEDAAYDAGFGDLVDGYPSVAISREYVDDPSEIFTLYEAHKNDFAYGNLSIATALSGNVVTADLTFTPDANLNTDYRFALIVTEDNVTGTSPGYAQANFYSYQSDNKPLSGAGFNWQQEPKTIPASKMVYNYVGRKILDGFKGTPSSLPKPMTAGTNYTKTYTYTIPPTSQIWKTKVIGVVIHQGSGIVCNSAVAQVALGVNNVVKSLNSVTLYPNPANKDVYVGIDANEIFQGNLLVTNDLGQVVYSESITLNTGANTLQIPVANLASGLYTLSISSKEGRFTERFAVSK